MESKGQRRGTGSLFATFCGFQGPNLGLQARVNQCLHRRSHLDNPFGLYFT